MIIERIKSAGLAHNSYFIGSGSSALVIDPRRDSQIYFERALDHGMKIKYILETHRNEDYVIGSLDLAGDTGAEIFHGPGLDWGYGNTLKEGQEFHIGKLNLTAIKTPGHTDESMSYILNDLSTGQVPVGVFTGDVLFVNDTGRADLYGLNEIPRMASNLYESIFERLLPLGDGTIIYPGHGSGSVCGTSIADRDDSTLGIERLQNPSLQVKSKEEFISRKLAERPERPPYFRRMEKYNLEGPPVAGCLPIPAPLAPAEFRKEMENGAIVVDASEPAAFGGAHIRGAYNIWLDGIPSFAGWLLPYDKPLLLVLEDQSHLEKAVRYLIRVGYDNIRGFLKDGTEGWYNAGFPTESVSLLSVYDLKARLDSGEDLVVLDTRGLEEWDSGHIGGSMHVPVGHVEQKLGDIPRDKAIAVLCSVGHRAGIAASILLKAGYPKVFTVLGSVTAWRNAGYPLTIE